MKRRLKEMEEEAAALREMQAKVAKEMQGSESSFPHVRSFHGVSDYWLEVCISSRVAAQNICVGLQLLRHLAV
jgi:hypothetical protein